MHKIKSPPKPPLPPRCRSVKSGGGVLNFGVVFIIIIILMYSC